MLDSQPVASQSWQGKLSLAYERRADQTILSRVQVQAPLKVQRPFYPEGGLCHSVMLHTAGGIVGSDRLAIEVALQPQSEALITTAAATKVYRSNGSEAEQVITLKLASGACLEWLPQETILFDGACYRQKLRVDLAAGATWLGWEMTRLGRSARGERFDTGEWHSRIEVWQAGILVWVDPQWIAGGSAMLTSPHGLANCPVVGSMAFVGANVDPEVLDRARVVSPQLGITQLQTGLLCRYLGNSTAEAKQQFIAVWKLLRPIYLIRPVCIPRVW